MTEPTNIPRTILRYARRNIHTIFEWIETDEGPVPVCVCGAVGRPGRTERQFLHSREHTSFLPGVSSDVYIVKFETDPTSRELNIFCRRCGQFLPFPGWGGTVRYNPDFDLKQIADHQAACSSAASAE